MAKDLKGYLNQPDTGAGDAGHQIFEPEPSHMPDASVLARRHEYADIGIKGLLTFAVAMVVLTGVALAGVWYFMVVMQGLEKKSVNAQYPAVSDLTVGDVAAAEKGRQTVRDLPRDHFPEPRLQPSVYHPRTDEVDMKMLRAKQEADLIQNGWERDPQSGGLKLSNRAIAAAGAFLGATGGPATQPTATQPGAVQPSATQPVATPDGAAPAGETGGAK